MYTKTDVYKAILIMFYRRIIQSVLTFCIACWYGNISAPDKKMNKIIICAKWLGCIDVDDLGGSHCLREGVCVQI